MAASSIIMTSGMGRVVTQVELGKATRKQFFVLWPTVVQLLWL